MTKHMTRFLFAAALTLAAGSALAQGTVLGWGQANRRPSGATNPTVPSVGVHIVGGINTADTSGVPFQFNADGTLRSNEASKDRDKVIKYDNIINDTCAVGMADSTAVLLDTHDAGRGYLYIRVTLAAGQTAPVFMRMAVRVQGCTNAADDSTNTFNITPRALAATDTLGVNNIVTAPTAVAVAGTEYIVTIGADNTTTTKWGRSHTIILPLADNSPGGWFWAENTKVMVRNITSGMTGGVPTITVSYRGTPL